MIEWLFVPAAYLIGSISSAIIICRLMGLPDPREQGSGNPGATNVMRIGGKKAAAITLLGDLLKGLIPVYIANLLGVSVGLLASIGLAAFLGHLYPVFFKFKGGKGVATSIGVLLGFSWLLGFAFIGTWLLIYKMGKISSVSALCASVLSPVYAWLISGDIVVVGASVVMMVLLLWRHKSNIQRLLDGNE
ncbi:MAG: glycerol-3-phosphate 1-O-acyltransferase PlsY [Methylococcaceae bacterium]|jgi:glycerol-3-phosphate acyltransferase PlsY|nr:glycerol-3-phosphate 1-O-acyltransferase PlsY [Methylococcaceae bacterium]MDD1638541.1 glycerol-3-phosphate 1-O-acyltransferase PlsY [Methylococcaceae bacterium]MDD1644222.1 glycerol-3-phosphate 1-O-acyltransferase PlsY [Methylococcaceae bacterium]OYV19236.1 MAG: glycerol-3-phosphate acyltransferase [Methylococcaceae bacterium NSM2-1]